MNDDTRANEGRGPTRQKKTYWWMVIAVAIASGVGLVLYFSIPIFFSPGGGIGEPTNLEQQQQQQQQPSTVGGTAAGELPNGLSH
jgi:hypothetical protein